MKKSKMTGYALSLLHEYSARDGPAAKSNFGG